MNERVNVPTVIDMVLSPGKPGGRDGYVLEDLIERNPKVCVRHFARDRLLPLGLAHSIEVMDLRLVPQYPRLKTRRCSPRDLRPEPRQGEQRTLAS
jgi:hypothetical protein